MSHYFSEKPTTKNIQKIIEYRLNNFILKFLTASSVFSRDQIDKGTDLLIRESIVQNNAAVLDLGCGYGPIGISIKKMYPYSSVTMSDINERSLELTKKNIILNQVEAEVIKSFLFDSIITKFDVILSNPPFSAGKKLCFDLIEKSIDALNKKGNLQIVAPHKKGGKELKKKMLEIFGNVKDIAIQSGYHIYISQKE